SPWYDGPTLLGYLEDISPEDAQARMPFRMPVQWVNRPNSEFRGYCGRVSAGSVRVGDRVCVLPGGIDARVKSIVVWQGETPVADFGESITLTLDRDLDVSRGDVVAAADAPPEVSDQFEAQILCLAEHQRMTGRVYLMKLHTCQFLATITRIK